MHLVIAIGQPRFLEFAIVSEREAVPAGAQIYATFSGEYASVQLDEEVFEAMTDEEYFTFRALVQEAREREVRQLRAGAGTCAKSLLNKLRRWLGGRRPANQTE